MSRRILILITILAVSLSLSLGLAAQEAVAQGGSTAVMTPASGPPGTTVKASGSNWTPGDHIQAEWGDNDSNLGAPVVVASDGTFTDSFAIPSSATQGSHQVLFWDEEGRYFEVANFNVTSGSSTPPPSSCPAPSVLFLSAGGPVGTTFVIAGSNWVPGGTVTSTLPYGSPGWFTGYQTPTVGANGGFDFKETVGTGPHGPTPPGTYTFTFVEKYGGCSLSIDQTFTVTASQPPPQVIHGAACVFDASKAFLGTKLIGHVGWGFELHPGWWEFGANEGPGRGPLGALSRTWTQVGTWEQMLSAFRNYYKLGYYKTYRCANIDTSSAAISRAGVVANHEFNEIYLVPTQDCESQVYNVLTAYGVEGLPSDTVPWNALSPNLWYLQLPSAGFAKKAKRL